MINTLTIENTKQEMCDTLWSDGVFKIDEYLSGDTLQKLHDDILTKCQNEAGHYEFGRNYRGESLGTYPHDHIISQVYNKNWMKELYSQYTSVPIDRIYNYGMNVFATHDYKYTGELARNGWLHFDRLWRLKFFIYLTDIDETCGAFSCCVGSRKKGDELRKVAWFGNDYEETKNRIELDYPELLENYMPEPVNAKAGTLIVFDTNTFHKGGQVEQGKERLVVRLHCG